MTGHPLRVGAVVLAYNSDDDLPDCLAGLIAQTGVDLRIIVVDNNSRPDARTRMETAFRAALPGGRILDADEAQHGDLSDLPAVFVRNSVNGGYSAGNNIGARLASAIGCEAVLIVNPDVRLSDPGYVAALGDLILADPNTAVACSAVRNLSGAQENPMIEPGFAEEMLWPVTMLTAGLFARRSPAPPLPTAPCRVAKVSGACFLIRTDFLRRIGFFDETVFLYCEESILMAQVRAAGWHMMMDPGREALHAHRSSAKGNPLPRFRAWRRSRSRFHAVHGGYGLVGRAVLAVSRAMTMGLVGAREFFKRLRSGGANTNIEPKE